MPFFKLHDSFRFGLHGLAGALVGALLFEVLIPALPKAPPPPPPPSVEMCLLIDCSSSMSSKAGGPKTKMEEVKEAAKTFVDQNISEGSISVVQFSDSASTAAPLTKDAVKLKSGIDQITDNGSTGMDTGLQAAAREFSYTPGSLRYLILFTDGMPNSKPLTLQAAEEVRNKQIEIIAIGTGEPPDGADLTFLAELARKDAIPASGGQFKVAFQKASEIIRTRPGMIEAAPTTASASRVMLNASLWAAFLAVGIGLSLIAGQNRYLRLPLLSFKQCAIGIPSAVLAGLLAGFIGQALFGYVSAIVDSDLVNKVCRIVSWTLLGGFLGCGMGFLVPNLKRVPASLGGATGGALGAIGFQAAAGLIGDLPARLAGGGLLGFCIGIMLAIIINVLREAWLEVSYGPNEVRRVTLGVEPVSIGGDQKSVTVFARNAPAVAYRYWLKDNTLFCEDVPNHRTVKVSPGDSRQAGNVTVKVCGSGKEVQKTAAAAPAPRAAGGGFTLLLSNGRSLPLAEGVKLSASDLPGLESIPPGGPVAQVSRHPKDPKIFGLQNLARASWKVRLANGDSVEVKPGKSTTLAHGTVINFGAFTGEIKG